MINTRDHIKVGIVTILFTLNLEVIVKVGLVSNYTTTTLSEAQC